MAFSSLYGNIMLGDDEAPAGIYGFTSLSEQNYHRTPSPEFIKPQGPGDDDREVDADALDMYAMNGDNRQHRRSSAMNGGTTTADSKPTATTAGNDNASPMEDLDAAYGFFYDDIGAAPQPGPARRISRSDGPHLSPSSGQTNAQAPQHAAQNDAMRRPVAVVASGQPRPTGYPQNMTQPMPPPQRQGRPQQPNRMGGYGNGGGGGGAMSMLNYNYGGMMNGPMRMGSNNSAANGNRMMMMMGGAHPSNMAGSAAAAPFPSSYGSYNPMLSADYAQKQQQPQQTLQPLQQQQSSSSCSSSSRQIPSSVQTTGNHTTAATAGAQPQRNASRSASQSRHTPTGGPAQYMGPFMMGGGMAFGAYPPAPRAAVARERRISSQATRLTMYPNGPYVNNLSGPQGARRGSAVSGAYSQNGMATQGQPQQKANRYARSGSQAGYGSMVSLPSAQNISQYGFAPDSYQGYGSSSSFYNANGNSGGATSGGSGSAIGYQNGPGGTMTGPYSGGYAGMMPSSSFSQQQQQQQQKQLHCQSFTRTNGASKYDAQGNRTDKTPSPGTGIALRRNFKVTPLSVGELSSPMSLSE